VLHTRLHVDVTRGTNGRILGLPPPLPPHKKIAVSESRRFWIEYNFYFFKKAVPWLRRLIAGTHTPKVRVRPRISLFEICGGRSGTGTPPPPEYFRYSCRYSDWLRAGRFGDRIPSGAKFFAHVQTGPGAHPASCTMGTRSFPGVKRPGRDADHPPPPNAEVENE
jgi:hypothetical protein